jgi:hypothetical protein
MSESLKPLGRAILPENCTWAEPYDGSVLITLTEKDRAFIEAGMINDYSINTKTEKEK